MPVQKGAATEKTVANEVMQELSVNAPKDAVDRKSIYIMVDTLIEGTKRMDGSSSQEIYLDSGRLEGKLEIIGQIADAALRSRICDVQHMDGFRKLVKGLGVSVSIPESENMDEVRVVWKHYGKKDRYGRGTKIEFACPTDGREVLKMFDDVVWDEEDEVVGNLTFFLGYPGQIAEVNVRFIVDDSLDVPEGGRDSKVERESEAYRAMIAKSLVSAGGDGRLERAIKRCKEGEPMTVAFIGGSITQGAGAKPINSRCYAYQTFCGFRDRFAAKEEQLTYVKAGVGGTPSEFGLLRYRKEVGLYGKRQADVVVIEFAVNDYDDETNGRCYESLVREVLSAKNAPAVVLLFSVFANDGNLQERLIPIGDYYKLPMVSVKNAVVPQFGLKKEEGRVISKRQFFYDTFHPTNVGHEVMTDCLLYLFDTVEKKVEEGAPIADAASLNKDMQEWMKGACYGRMFDGIRIIERFDEETFGIQAGSFTAKDNELQCVERNFDVLATPEFTENWKHVPGSNEPFCATITAKSVFLIFKDSGDVKTGSAQIFVNGQEVLLANPHINNWTHCNARLIADGDTAKEYKIKVQMAEEDVDKTFTILALGYTTK